MPTELADQQVECLGTHVVLKRHDTGPRLAMKLRNPDNTLFDLTGYTDATFYMAVARSPTLELVSGVASIDVASAELRYQWQSGDLVDAGDFDAEFEVFDADGRRRTFPPDTFIWVQVLDDLDDA